MGVRGWLSRVGVRYAWLGWSEPRCMGVASQQQRIHVIPIAPASAHIAVHVDPMKVLAMNSLISPALALVTWKFVAASPGREWRDLTSCWLFLPSRPDHFNSLRLA